MTMTDEDKLSTVQVRQAVRDGLAEAKKALEKVRHLMVYRDKDDCFRADEIHAVALAQYELDKLVEDHDPRDRPKKRR
jgi:ribulose-5-phosphate 4-epimerase/fuculose-1-phosphate aldolase